MCWDYAVKSLQNKFTEPVKDYNFGLNDHLLHLTQ